MLIISAVGLFCCDKLEETPNEKVVNMSKLNKSYFSAIKNEQVIIGYQVPGTNTYAHYIFSVHYI